MLLFFQIYIYIYPYVPFISQIDSGYNILVSIFIYIYTYTYIYVQNTCLEILRNPDVSSGEEGFRAYYEITDRISRGAKTTHDPVRVCDYMAPWQATKSVGWFWMWSVFGLGGVTSILFHCQVFLGLWFFFLSSCIWKMTDAVLLFEIARGHCCKRNDCVLNQTLSWWIRLHLQDSFGGW